MRVLLVIVFFVFVACKEEKKYHDDLRPSLTGKPELIKDILEWQRNKDAEFKDPETSPLTDLGRKDFKGLAYFEADTLFRVVAKLQRTPDALPFMMPTTTEREAEEKVYGIVSFEMEGKTHSLEVYQSPELMQQKGYEDYLFLPFLDATNGGETYTGGRYLDLRIPEGDIIIVDFNKAYNPFCVYNKDFSCPIVPVRNTLNVAVRAGVKAYVKDGK
jgi:uncharacterized protein (DUF1684 family)